LDNLINVHDPQEHFALNGVWGLGTPRAVINFFRFEMAKRRINICVGTILIPIFGY
jgi:hypothetical protein